MNDDAGAGAGLGEGGDPPSFHTSVKNPELQTWAQQRGWKDSDAVVESFRNAEKLLGAPRERLLVLPEAADAPEWDAVHARLGMPDAADKYAIDLKGQYDADFLNWFKGVAHKGKLSQQSAGLIATEWESYIDAMVQQQEAAGAEARERELAQLRTEWGGRFEASTAAAAAAAAKVGLTNEQYAAVESAIGPLAARRAFGLVASSMLEAGGDPLPPGGGGSTGFSATPEAARRQLEALESDTAFMAKYASGDRAAFKRMSDLNALAYPDAT